MRLAAAAPAAMSAQEAGFLDAMIAGFLPVSRRREGLANEAAVIAPGAAVDLPAIAAPALVLQASGGWCCCRLRMGAVRPRDG